MVSLSPNTYPVNNLRTSQPVRFTYLNDKVAVSSWDSLSDGEIGLSEVLLAGTILDVLPGQAVIEVGSRPVVVPQSFVWSNGQRLAWNNVQPGLPVDVRYYPGVYRVVDYSNDYFTLSYNDNIVQFPASVKRKCTHHAHRKFPHLGFGFSEALSEAVRVALDLNDMSVMGKSVHQGTG